MNPTGDKPPNGTRAMAIDIAEPYRSVGHLSDRCRRDVGADKGGVGSASQAVTTRPRAGS